MTDDSEEKVNLEYCCGEDGTAFVARGHVDKAAFMRAVAREVDSDDPILAKNPTHEWSRVCRDFEEGQSIYAGAIPGSRGAFKTTWVRSYEW